MPDREKGIPPVIVIEWHGVFYQYLYHQRLDHEPVTGEIPVIPGGIQIVAKAKRKRRTRKAGVLGGTIERLRRMSQ